MVDPCLCCARAALWQAQRMVFAEPATTPIHERAKAPTHLKYCYVESWLVRTTVGNPCRMLWLKAPPLVHRSKDAVPFNKALRRLSVSRFDIGPNQSTLSRSTKRGVGSEARSLFHVVQFVCIRKHACAPKSAVCLAGMWMRPYVALTGKSRAAKEKRNTSWRGYGRTVTLQLWAHAVEAI